jgi:RNA polymerase sigma-70 factor, ECF subfamily
VVSVLFGRGAGHSGHMTDGTSAPDATFETVVLPHLDAGYRLARWLVRNDQDAEDVVQDAVLRALQYFRTFTGGNGRAWFLRIVRNSYHERLAASSRRQADEFDEERHSGDWPRLPDPETLLLRADAAALIERTISGLPERFRILLTLREFEELSYRELADVLDIPSGSVMSGLSRARQAFRTAFERELDRQSRSNDIVTRGRRDPSGIFEGVGRLGGCDASAIRAGRSTKPDCERKSADDGEESGSTPRRNGVRGRV